MSFYAEFNNNDSHVVLSLVGRLMDLKSEEQLLADIDKSISEDNKNFIIDMERLEYMNSTGLSMLVKLLTKARNAGGEAIVCNVSQAIRQLFVVTKLTTVFKIAESMTEANEMVQHSADPID